MFQDILTSKPSDAPEKHEPRDLRVLYPEACETQLQPTTYNLHTICPQGTLFSAAIMEHKLQAVRKSQCDLLEQLVRFDPNKRPSACEALRHPYLDDLHDEDDARFASWGVGASWVHAAAASA